MLYLASQSRALFIGQSVAYPGVAMYHDLDGVPMEQRIEFPVAEELQVGFGAGLALMGYFPILIFPRIDFLMRAADQLVNHLDKLRLMSCDQFRPGLIIRTRVGTKKPLDAGPQHTQHHTRAFTLMMQNTPIMEITDPKKVKMDYEGALMIASNGTPVMVVENFGA